jgi:hypothetical protein
LFGRAEARVMPIESDISAFEGREEDGEWRVEYFDDDGGCYVAVFAGPEAQRRAQDCADALKAGVLTLVTVGCASN